MTARDQFLLFMTIVMLLMNVLVSVFFAHRNYKKNFQLNKMPRVFNSIGQFILVFILIGVIMVPIWGYFVFATYDRSARMYPSSEPNIEEYTREELTELRRQIPFLMMPLEEKLGIDNPVRLQELSSFLDYLDEPVKSQISRLMCTAINPKTSMLSLSFDSSNNDFVLYTALNNTELICNMSDSNMRSILTPISEQHGDTQYLLKEHVEECAKILFGKDIVVTHQSFSGTDWQYDDYCGIYYPFPGGAYQGQELPIVLEYEDLGNYYKAIVMFYMWDGLELIPREEAIRLIEQNYHHRSEIILQKNEDGSFYLRSCKPADMDESGGGDDSTEDQRDMIVSA